jgi:DNA-binding NarL/FixJ family response regulator
VLIADDDKVFRELLTVVIEAEGSLELVGAAADAQEAIDLARRDPPDVAVLDLNMPGGFGTRAAREIRALAPATQILALTALDNDDARLEIQRAGATGFVVKGASPAEILEAIRAIAKPT